MAEFYEAPVELVDMAHGLIEKYHGHLIEARIKYLMRDGTWNTQKRETWGQAKKVGKEVNFLTGYDFIITIHNEVWGQLNQAEREALLDHELQHCFAGTDDAGNKIWGTQGHDVEDFHAVIRRHGLWSRQLKKLGETLNQIELDLEFADQSEMQPEELTALTGRTIEELPGRPKLQLVGSAPRQLPAPETEDDAPEGSDDPADPEIIDAEVVLESDDTNLGYESPD